MNKKLDSKRCLLTWSLVAIVMVAAPSSSEANLGGLARMVNSIKTGANASMVITGGTAVAAAYSSSNAVEAKYARELSSGELDRLRSSGVDTRGDAFFSLYMRFDGGKAEMFWSDWFSKPDMMTIVDVEGQGTYLLPNIRTNYDANVPILERIVGKSVPPGTRIIVAVFDCDDGTNQILNHWLKTPVSLDGSAKVYFPIPVGIGSVSGGVGANISILGSDVVFNNSELIGVIEMEAPRANQSGQWRASGNFITNQGEKLGEYSFSQFWSAKGRQELVADVQTHGGRQVFWWVIAGALGLYFISRLFAPSKA